MNFIISRENFIKVAILSFFASFLSEFANTDLQKELPVLKKVSSNFDRFFRLANLARIRHGNTAVTIFGGNYKNLIYFPHNIHLTNKLKMVQLFLTSFTIEYYELERHWHPSFNPSGLLNNISL